MKILDSVKAAPEDIGMLALCYSVLKLEQSELPPLYKREAHFDYLLRGLGAEEVRLGRKVLQEIEDTERVDLEHLDQDKRNEYNQLFSETVHELILRDKRRREAGAREASRRARPVLA